MSAAQEAADESKKRVSDRKRVLITGVTSVIGRQLAERLMHDKKVDTIIGISRDPRPYYFDDFNARKFHYKQVNILKPRELTNLFLDDTFKDAKIDTVAHLAFMHRPEDTTHEAHELNVEGTKNLLDKCLETPSIRKFIFKSSANVYKLRPFNSVRLKETDDLNFDPDVDPLLKDQVDADMLCRAKMDNRRMKIVILRPSATIGRNVHAFMNTYLESSVCMSVAGFNPMINLIHVKDVIRAIQLAIHRNVQGIFNIAGKETAPLSDFARLCGAVTVPLPQQLVVPLGLLVKQLGLSKFDPRTNIDRIKYSCLLDTDKAKEVLGFEPQHHIKFA